MSANFRFSGAFCGLLAGALMATSAATAQVVAPPAADAAGAVATPDAGAPAKPKPKPKKAEPQTVAVVVTNKRAVALTDLLASAAGSPESKKIVGELAPGKKIVVHLTHDKDCLFDLHGDYEDGSTTDAVGVALCKDKTINLTE
jgi:hypothetical protein